MDIPQGFLSVLERIVVGVKIETVIVKPDTFTLVLSDGSGIMVSWSSYPKLDSATMKQRKDWRLIGDGEGIHWSQLDEDLSLDGFFTDPWRNK